MHHITVRTAEPAQLAAVLALWDAAEHSKSVTDNVESLGSVLDHPHATLLIALDGEVIVGSALPAWDGWRGSIHRVVLHPGLPGPEDVGLKLIAAAVHWLGRFGTVRVSAPVADTAEAQRIWERAGFRHDPHTCRFVQDTTAPTTTPTTTPTDSLTDSPAEEDRPTADPLARPAVERADARRMIDDVVAQPTHVRDALALMSEADLPRGEFPGGLVICGVGGSGLAGDITAAIIGPRARRPIQTVRSYLPEAWVGPGTFVFCPSYSGNTDITLEYVATAHAAGAAVVTLTSGGRLVEMAAQRGLPLVRVPAGFQPRALTSYAIVAALHCAAAAGAGPDLRPEVAESADFLDDLVREWGPESPEDSLAKSLAHALHETGVLIYGSGPTTAAAHRWKTQLNETGKLLAFSSELLEADHHELCVWGHLKDPSAWSAVFLADEADQHPGALRRMELTADLIASTGAPTHWIAAPGETRTQRMLSLVLLADFVSVYTAALSGVDPSDIELISELNRLVG